MLPNDNKCDLKLCLLKHKENTKALYYKTKHPVVPAVHASFCIGTPICPLAEPVDGAIHRSSLWSSLCCRADMSECLRGTCKLGDIISSPLQHHWSLRLHQNISVKNTIGNRKKDFNISRCSWFLINYASDVFNWRLAELQRCHWRWMRYMGIKNNDHSNVPSSHYREQKTNQYASKSSDKALQGAWEKSNRALIGLPTAGKRVTPS